MKHRMRPPFVTSDMNEDANEAAAYLGIRLDFLKGIFEDNK